jgi:hypothetical protein
MLSSASGMYSIISFFCFSFWYFFSYFFLICL